jgi:5-hydroxyisourate hydrolase-like protein (transthyretin family)
MAVKLLLLAALLYQDKASISGYVLNMGTGEPLAKVTVTLSPFNGGTSRSFTASTTSGGQFTFQSIDPGQYRLSATRNGFIKMEYGARRPRQPGLPIVLNAGQRLADIGLRMMPAGTIAGRILDRDGEPMANVTVTALKYAYQEGQKALTVVQNAQTNDLGEYRLFWMQPGQYFVSATPANPSQIQQMPTNNEAEGYIPVYYPGTTDAAAAAPIDLPPGTIFSGVDLTVAAVHTVRITGQLINGVTGQPATNANISLVQARAGVRNLNNRGKATSTQGVFEFGGVGPGSYELIGMLVDRTGRMTATVPVQVGNADVQNVSVVLTPGFAVNGHLSIEGQPAGSISQDLTRLRVMLRGDNPAVGTPASPVQPDGTFTLQQVARDNYRLTVSGMPQNAYIKDARYGATDILNEGLKLDRPPNGPIEISVARNAGRLTGAVQNDRQEASANVTVVVVPDVPRRARLDLYRTASTDAMGQFHIEGIPPGDYKVFSWEEVETGAWQDPDFIRNFEDRGEPVRINEGGGTSNINLRVIPPQV